jgi:ABC-type polysaccharide/polyol phosphate export permease
VAGVAFGMERLNRLYARFRNYEKMLKVIVALLFMILGVFFIVEFYFEHGH